MLGLKIVVRIDHASLRWMFRQNAHGITFRMVQNLQEYNYTILYRPGRKHGNADGLTRLEDPREDWKEVELEALPRHCPEPKSYEEALEIVRDFLKLTSELRPSAPLNAAASDQPDESCPTLMTSNRYPDPVMEIENFLIDSCRSIVLCITIDFRLVTLYQDEPNFDPFLAETLPTLRRQPMPSDVFAIRVTEKISMASLFHHQGFCMGENELCDPLHLSTATQAVVGEPWRPRSQHPTPWYRQTGQFQSVANLATFVGFVPRKPDPCVGTLRSAGTSGADGSVQGPHRVTHGA